MALYDRDYTSTEAGYAQEGASVSFMKTTYQLLALGMSTAAIGAYIIMPYAAIIMQYFWVMFGFILLTLWFGFPAVRGNKTLSLALFFIFTFTMGALISPQIAMFVETGRGNIITNAFLSTSILFGALSLFAINSKTDFSSWGKPLFITFVVLLLMSLVNYFIFHSPIMGILVSAAVLLLFSLFTIYDTQNIANGAYDSPIDAAISLFTDFISMFSHLLHLLGIFGSDD